VSDDAHLEPYLAVVARVTGLARGAEGALDENVPACPQWTARQVIAHLAGLAEDWVAGRLDDYGSDTWAAAQVTRFEGQSLDEVLAAWSAAANAFSTLGPSPIGGTPARWAFGDGVVHEADLCPVLAPGRRVPEEAMALGLKAAVARWRVELGAAGVPPLDVVATDMRTWRVGDPDAAAHVVTTTGYELFRGLFGRRTRAQVEASGWSCAPDTYLDVGLPYPFRWATTPLQD
jgi:uncharacterized protein (TIGR03083 family)